MGQNTFSSEEVRELWKAFNRKDDAIIDFQQQNAPDIIKTLTVKLDNKPTNPKKLGFAFKSVYIQEASDSGTEIKLRPFSNTNSNDVMTLTKNDVLNFDQPVQNVFLDWEAQSGKEVTLVFILNGQIRAGSLFTQVSSAVDGNSFDVKSPQTLTSTPTKILDQNLKRTNLWLKATGNFEIGSSSSGNFFSVGSQYKDFKNTGEIWAKVVAGNEIIEILEQE